MPPKSQPPKSHILYQYLKHYEEATIKYGKACVLMQIGGFSEIYSSLTDEGPNMTDISGVTNCSIAMKNKSTENAHYMIGWPKIADSKYIPILIDAGYHVIVIEQLPGSPTHIVREITNVISAGTAMEYNTNENNYLMSIHIENYEQPNKKTYHGCGISIIDVATGKNYTTQILDDMYNNRSYEAKIIHLMNIYSPSEVIIHNVDTSFSKDDYIHIFNIPHESVIVNFFKDKLSKFSKLSFQNEFLNKIFNFTNMLSGVENIHCETKPETVISYIILLEYVHQHRENIVLNLDLPEEIENISYLNLTKNSIRQINIISNNNDYTGRNDSLWTIINQCKTPLGKRLLKERISHPFINPNDIIESYDWIELFLKDDFYNIVRPEISKISDIEKSIRKMGVDTYKSDELLSDSISYNFVRNTIKLLKSNEMISPKLEKYNSDIDLYYKFLDELNENFEWDNFNTVNSSNIIERSLFKKSIHEEIDKIDIEIEKNKKNLDYICERLSRFIDQKNNCTLLPIKIEYSDKDNYYIYCTANRGMILKEKFKNLHNQNINVKNDDGISIYSLKPESFSFKNIKGGSTKIELDIIGTISNNLVKYNKTLSYLNQQFWDKYIKELYEKYNIPLKNICKLISEVDFYTNAAHISKKNRYHKPTIIDSDKSFVSVKEIRHPIIELINDKHEYITNDIDLGLGHDGVLLFGTNSCGKSSLMKALGINIVLAQAGLYVAALDFKFYPYKKLYTRILNTDNIFTGHSSFIVEMNELRDILHSADDNSIVLADELAIGTETTSALSIVASSLKILCDKKVSFICTSHLHQLNEISIVKELTNLKIYHLKITNDNETIIYDRKLEEGSGPPIYGLTVCNALNLGKDFIALARKVQMEINGENNNIINEKKSVYNKSVVMDVCSMPICDKPAVESHHIKEQCDADENNNFDHHHKNKKHNLIPLCKKCHAQITFGSLHIKGWKETSEGDKLDYEFIDNKQDNKKKKYSNKDVYNIEQYHEKYTGKLPKQKIIDKLHADKDIKITMHTFNKIIKGEY